MKIITFFLVMVFAELSIIMAQPIDTLWTRTITAAPNSNFSSYEMIKYSSNEFILSGNCGDSLYIVKVNTNGNIIWEKYIYTPGGLVGQGLEKDSFGNFYVIVMMNGIPNKWQLIKFNEIGDSLWNHTLSFPDSSFYLPYAITVNGNNVYVAASSGNGPEKFALNKFNLDGNPIYAKSYETGSSFSIPRSITNDSYGNIIIAGTGGLGWYLLKCNPDGDVLWSRTLSANFWNNEARTAITDNNDNIICTGWVNKIIKYDSNGNLIFDKPLGSNTNCEAVSLIKYDISSVITIGGMRRSNGVTYDLLLGKYSIETGNPIWTDIWYHPDYAFGVYGWDGAVYFDSVLIVLATTYSEVASNFFSNIYLMRFSLEDTPVPVELVSFTANTTNEGNVLLNWTTASEINNQGFEIERSQMSEIREQSWKKIGYVSGFGTSTEPTSYSFTDENVTTGTYHYRLKQIDFDGSYKYSDEINFNGFAPIEFNLYQNYPNPFNPTTKISWKSPVSSWQTLKVYDILGNEVATLVDGYKPAGSYQVEFNASGLTSGVYFYELKAGEYSNIKKLILMK